MTSPRRRVDGDDNDVGVDVGVDSTITWRAWVETLQVVAALSRSDAMSLRRRRYERCAASRGLHVGVGVETIPPRGTWKRRWCRCPAPPLGRLRVSPSVDVVPIGYSRDGGRTSPSAPLSGANRQRAAHGQQPPAATSSIGAVHRQAVHKQQPRRSCRQRVPGGLHMNSNRRRRLQRE